MKNIISILLINDEVSDLEFYRDSIIRNCDKSIIVNIFGPKEAGTSEVGKAFLKNLRDNLPLGDLDLNEIDLLFVDYRMQGLNGVDFLRLLRKNESRISTTPVVLMTKFEDQLLNKLKNGLGEGLSGYIFTNREFFWLDVEATAHRVFQEKQREKWAESLMEISSSLSIVDSKNSLCKLIIDKMEENCPHVKVFIREFNYKTQELKLLFASPNIPSKYTNDLQFVNYKKFPMLEKAIKGEVYWYNSFKELEGSKPGDKELSTCKELQLHRGMSFPVKDRHGKVFATISMYRRFIDPPFTFLEKSYAELMIKQISETWTIRHHKQQGEAYTLFLKEFTGCENENELFQKLVRHLHDELNIETTGDFLSKTTFKILYPGTDKLFCQSDKRHHLGVPRDPEFSPSIYSQKSVSAWVARENKSRLISNYNDQSDYATTNKQMQSELCVPVSSNAGSGDPVIGVLNLECSKINYYTEEDLYYAETLCRLAGYYVDRLRTASFLHHIIGSLANCTTRDDLILRSIEIIRKFTGYRLLLFVIRDSTKWIITNIDVAKKDANKEAIKVDIQDWLEHQPDKTLIQKAFTQQKPIYYVPNLQELSKDDFFVPSNILYEHEKLCSQAVFLMKSGDEVVGGLSLDFVILNALSDTQRELLGHLAGWLGRLILQDNIYTHLCKKIEYLDQISLFTDFMSKIWHKSEGYLHSLRNLAEECVGNESLKKIPELYENILQIQTGLEQIKGLPVRIEALAKKPIITDVNILNTWNVVLSELADKIKNFGVKIVAPDNIPTVKADANIMEMIFYHLLDNSLDACENSEQKEIVLGWKNLSSSKLVIQLSDTGEYISDDVINNMTELTFTTKPHGSGYGLAWVAQKAHEMNIKFILKKRHPQPGLEAVLYFDI